MTESNDLSPRLLAELALDSYGDAMAALSELMFDETVVAVKFERIYLAKVDWQMEITRTFGSRAMPALTDDELRDRSRNNESKVTQAFLDAFEILPVEPGGEWT